MPTKPITARLAESLRSLAVSQLQMQTVRSAALDGGALGVVAVDAAIAALIVDTGGTHHFGILALALLGLSLALAVAALRLPGAEQTGPVIEAIHEARKTQDDDELEESLREDLAEDVQTNDEALVRKARLFNGALTFLVLAIIVELAGRIQ